VPSPPSRRPPEGTGDPAVQLADVHDALAVLFCGLSAQWAEILADDDIEPGIIPADTHDTMRLPTSCARFATAAENRGWYQVAVAHRAGHYVWSSFDLDIKAVLARLGVMHDDAMDLVTGTGDSMGHWASFFRLFRRIELAGAVFGAVEDARVDSRLAGLVPGFARSFDQVLADERVRRPALDALGPRDQALEVLQRVSIGYSGPLLVAPAVGVVARAIAELMPVAVSATATITDTSAVTALIYNLIDDLPILSTAEPLKIWLEPSPVSAGPVPLPDRFLGTFVPDVDVARLEGEDRVRVNVPPAAFRDVIGLRFRGIDHGSSGLKSELLIFKPGHNVVDRDYLEHDHDHEHEHEHDHEEPPAGLTPEPGPHEHYELSDAYYRERTRAADKARGNTYLYPEWDAVKGRYRQHWVTLREEIPQRGNGAGDLLASVNALSGTERRITSELERIADMGRVLVRRVRDGDEVDIDGAIEAIVELRAGHSADPRPYARVDRARRDVAVGIVLDLSSSTAERIDSSSPIPTRLNRDGSARRIIDAEREAVALLLRSLAKLGDSVGVYGFSGSGRNDVRVLTVKDFREQLSVRAFERMAGLKPIHMTRLAPVIRHVTRKLTAEAAETRLLMVITDGRPFDLDYGTDYPERMIEYANLDTRAAVDEALAKGIEPFVLTVDGEGNEYLSEVFTKGGGYEVVADIEDLRAALVRSYARVRQGGSVPRRARRAGSQESVATQ
jgi:nitric oxide reductase NorD protein